LVSNNPPIIVYEQSKNAYPKDTFEDEEIRIVETEFENKIEIIPRRTEDELRTHEYVGYIVLPNNVIVIKPKIPGTGFVNMLRYSLDLPELGQEHPELTKGEDYYDILVRFLFLGLEDILQRGLNTGYKNNDDNLMCVRGKILFKEHLTMNHNNNDKIFCSFSEMSSDIIENRIIKYTLWHLSHLPYFSDNTIDAQLIRYYNRLDEVNLVPITTDDFRSIEYTPLNHHYRSVLMLCELLLRDSALDEEIGEKTAISFLINMNKLFEEFIGNLLNNRLDEYEVELQKTEYPEIRRTGRSLRVKIDIIINRNGIPIFVMDTKYQSFSGRPEEGHLAQLSYYSDTEHVKDCALVYEGKPKSVQYDLKGDIRVHIVTFDLGAQNEYEFNRTCDDFINKVRNILYSLNKTRVKEY
jgi:5-methylcytosine-specific restriction enzyme subunit McrC